MMSALNTGLLGIQKGFAELHRNATIIASGEQDVVRPLVSLLQSKHQVEASIRIVRTIDEALGTLLDLRT